MEEKIENNIQENVKNDEEKVLVSRDEVFSVLEFINEIYSPITNLYGGHFSPDLINARMKDLNMSPQKTTLDKIEKALENPKTHEQELIGYTEWLELNSMLFKRVMGYFANLPAFDFTYICTTAEDKDYKTSAYKKDLALVKDFFDKFNYKEVFKTVMKELVRAETYFGVLREEGERYVLQELPQEYCKITGRYDYGLLFDFDYSWFSQSGVDIDFYPYVMKKALRKLNESSGDDEYKPSASISSRTGRFVRWHQTSPTDGFVAFKFSPEIATRVPILSPMMPNVVLEPIIRELQQNSYMAEATNILFGEVPMKKDTSTSLKDNVAISPKVLGQFLGYVKSALPSAIKVAAAPLTNAQALSFDSSNEIFDSYLQSTAASSGVNARLLYSLDRQNVLETKASLDIDENMLRLVYFQFENFLEYQINKRTKKHNFKFIFEGFETGIDREERLDKVTKLSESGIVLDQKFASAIGMNPFDFRRMLAETRSNEFVENLTPVMKSSQMPSDSDVGRPSLEDGELGDSGSDTRSAGSNEEKSEE